MAPLASEVKLSDSFKGTCDYAEGFLTLSVIVGPINPDIYPYSFSVDGVTVMDPANVSFSQMKGSRRV
jgi:enterochelin esterase family protein